MRRLKKIRLHEVRNSELQGASEGKTVLVGEEKVEYGKST